MLESTESEKYSGKLAEMLHICAWSLPNHNYLNIGFHPVQSVLPDNMGKRELHFDRNSVS